MGLRVAGVKDHQAHKDHHVRQAVQRRVEKPSKPRNAARKTGHLPVEHVKEIGDHEGDARREEPASPKKKTATDVQSNADDGQNVGIDMTDGEPANYRINDSLCCPSDTCTEHIS